MEIYFPGFYPLARVVSAYVVMCNDTGEGIKGLHNDVLCYSYVTVHIFCNCVYVTQHVL